MCDLPPSSEPGTRVERGAIHKSFQGHVACVQGSLGSMEESGREGMKMYLWGPGGTGQEGPNMAACLELWSEGLNLDQEE